MPQAQIHSSTVITTKTRKENATAICNCLAYLALEAQQSGLEEVRRLIELCRLAAADASREVLH